MSFPPSDIGKKGEKVLKKGMTQHLLLPRILFHCCESLESICWNSFLLKSWRSKSLRPLKENFKVEGKGRGIFGLRRRRSIRDGCRKRRGKARSSLNPRLNKTSRSDSVQREGEGDLITLFFFFLNPFPASSQSPSPISPFFVPQLSWLLR